MGSSELTQSIEWSHDAWRHGSLGCAARTARYLESIGKDTAEGIWRATPPKALSTVYRHLKRLRTAGLVVESDGVWTWAGGTEDELDGYAQCAGTHGRGALARIRHRLDRLAWVETLARSEEKRTMARKCWQEQVRRPRRTDENGRWTPTYSPSEAIALGLIAERRPRLDVDPETGEMLELAA
jgi:hypothetical protein